MLWLIYIFLFLGSCFLLSLSGGWVVNGLIKFAKFFGWREFVLAFFVMAIAASLPNLFLGITSAVQGIPSLSFGDVLGNNLVALTLAVALATLFAPNKKIPANSQTIQTTSSFTLIAAILPIVLIWDGVLSRTDGVLLISLFVFYLFWLFSKRERFTRVYKNSSPKKFESPKKVFEDFAKMTMGIVFLLIAAQGIVKSALFFVGEMNISLVLFGTLIVGLGNALPETYFAIISARRNETYMILGNLMGAVIIPATLVLGIVSLISPIEIQSDFDVSLISRIFLILAVCLFYWFARSGREITKKEASILLITYIVFVTTALFLGLH